MATEEPTYLDVLHRELADQVAAFAARGVSVTIADLLYWPECPLPAPTPASRSRPSWLRGVVEGGLAS